MRRFILLPIVLFGFLIAGCSGNQPENFKGREPAFIIEDYFQGETRAYGIFEDRFGKLRREFTVEIDGKMEDGVLVLDERFFYKDGETDRRVWKISKTGAHSYEGWAADIIGTAQGRSFGNALTWSYDMDLKVGEEYWRVGFEDWFYLQPDGVLLNRARITRFGIEIGTLTLVFLKEEA